MEITAMEDFDKIAYDKAKRKVKEMKAFYINLTLYLICMPIVITVNLIFSPEFQWFWFSLLGWGIGVFSHAMGTFGFYPFLGRNWEDRKLKEIMEKIDRKEAQGSKYE